MYTPSNRGRRYRIKLPIALLAVLTLSLGSVTAISLVADAYSPPVWMLVEYGLTLLLSAVLMYGAYWLATGEFTTDELWRTLWWTVGGIVTLAVIAGFVLVHRHFEGTSIVEPIFLVALLSLLGGVVGFATAVAQLHTVRVIEPSLEAEHGDGSAIRLSRTQGRSEYTDAGVQHADTDYGPEIFRSRAQEQSLTRRWATLKAVAACGDCSLDELATMLARDPRNSFTSDPERTKLLLHHQYLPSIARTGLIEFDDTTNLVRYTGPATLSN